MDSLAEMVKQQLAQRLEDIKNGKSFFGKIPDNIGELMYCDTTASESGPYDSKEKTRRTLLGTLIPIGLAALCYLISVGFGIFATVVALIVMFFVLRNTYVFKGKDMFVGTEGYAVYSFKKGRKNIIEEKVHRFEDLTDLIAEGTQIRSGAIGFLGLVTIYKGTYQGTKFAYVFYKQNGDSLTFVDGVQGEYNQENVEDKAEVLNEDFKFWTCIEQMWSRYKMKEYEEQFQNGSDTIPFTLVLNGSFFPSYIRLGLGKIIIANREYNYETLKNIGFSNGSLIVEHVNHTRKLFGLIQKGNQEEIPLNSISNRAVFLELLGRIIKIE